MANKNNRNNRQRGVIDNNSGDGMVGACCGISRGSRAHAEKLKAASIMTSSPSDNDNNLQKTSASNVIDQDIYKNQQAPATTLPSSSVTSSPRDLPPGGLSSSKSHPGGFGNNKTTSTTTSNKTAVKKKLRFDLPKATPYMTDNTAPQTQDLPVENVALNCSVNLSEDHHQPEVNIASINEHQNAASFIAPGHQSTLPQATNKIAYTQQPVQSSYSYDGGVINSPTSFTSSSTDQTLTGDNSNTISPNNNNNATAFISNANNTSNKTSTPICRQTSSGSDYYNKGGQHQPRMSTRQGNYRQQNQVGSDSESSTLMRRSRSATRQFIALSDGGDDLILSEAEPFAVYEMKTLLDAAEYENQELKQRVRMLQSRLAEKERVEMEYLNLHKEIEEEKFKRSKAETLLKQGMIELENQKHNMETEMKRFRQQQTQSSFNQNHNNSSTSAQQQPSQQEITAYRAMLGEMRDRLAFVEQENNDLRQQNLKLQQQRIRNVPDYSARIGQLEVERNQLLEQVAEMSEQRQTYERHFQQISAQLVRQVMSQKLLQDECATLNQQCEAWSTRCKTVEQILVDSGLTHLLDYYLGQGQYSQSSSQMTSQQQQAQRSALLGDALSASTFSFSDAIDQQLPLSMPGGSSTLPQPTRRSQQAPNNHILQQHLVQMQSLGMVETEFPADQPSPKTHHHVINFEDPTPMSDKQRMPPPSMKHPPQNQPGLAVPMQQQAVPPAEMRFAAKKSLPKSTTAEAVGKSASFGSNEVSPPISNSISSQNFHTARPPSSVTDQELWDLYGIPPPFNQVPVLPNPQQHLQQPRAGSGGQNSTHSSINDVLDTSGGSGGGHVYNVRTAQKQKQQNLQQNPAQQNQQKSVQNSQSSGKVPQQKSAAQNLPKPLNSIVPDCDPSSPQHYQSSSYRRFDSDVNCQVLLNQIVQQGGQHGSTTQSVSSDGAADSPEKCRRGSSSGLSSIAGSVIFRGTALGQSSAEVTMNNREDDKSSGKLSQAAFADMSFDSTDTSCITSPIAQQLNSSVESSVFAPAREQYIEQAPRQSMGGSLPPSNSLNCGQLRRISTDNSIKISLAGTTNTSILSTDSMVVGPYVLNSTHHSSASMSLNGSQSVANGTPIRQVVKGRFFGASKHLTSSSMTSSPPQQASSPLVNGNSHSASETVTPSSKVNQKAENMARLNRPISISDCNLAMADVEIQATAPWLTVPQSDSKKENSAKLRRVRSDTSLPQLICRSPMTGASMGNSQTNVSIHSLEWFSDFPTPNSQQTMRNAAQQTEFNNQNSNNQNTPDQVASTLPVVRISPVRDAATQITQVKQLEPPCFHICQAFNGPAPASIAVQVQVAAPSGSQQNRHQLPQIRPIHAPIASKKTSSL